MRSKFKLDLEGAKLEKAMVLIHGGYAAGKTHLLGDFLKFYSANGPVRFINVRGEDGSDSAKTFNIGDVGENVETYEDLIGALNDVKKDKCVALGIDSMKAVNRLAMAHVLGTSERMPSVGGNGNEWGAVHFAMENLTNRMRASAPFVMCVCPSDKSVNQLDGKTYITPDLPGREAAGSAGWFDLVGYISADVLGPGNVKWSVKFAPNTSVLTRQRLPRPLIADIIIPKDDGGWAAILGEINKTLTEKGEVKK